MNIRPGQKLVAKRAISEINVIEPVKHEHPGCICVIAKLSPGDTVEIIEPCGRPQRDHYLYIRLETPEIHYGDRFALVKVTLQARVERDLPSRTYVGKIYDSWLQYQIQHNALIFV